MVEAQPLQGPKVRIVLSEALTDDTPATIEPIVRAIGRERAVRLFLRFGGSTVYIAKRPQEQSRLAMVIGEHAMAALARHMGQGHLKVPLANAWIARQLAAEGVSRAEMCRMIRVSRTTLNGYLRPDTAPSKLSGLHTRCMGEARHA